MDVDLINAMIYVKKAFATRLLLGVCLIMGLYFVCIEEEEKLALFMKRIINFQQMIRCKEGLLRKDWRIINLLRVAGLQEDGPG